MSVGVCDTLANGINDPINMTVELYQPMDTDTGLHEVTLVYEAIIA